MCLTQTLVWLSSLLFSHHEIFKLVQYIPYSSPHEVFPFCKWNGMKFSSEDELLNVLWRLLHGFTWAEWKAQFVAIRMFGLARAVPSPVVHRPTDCACQRMSYSWFFMCVRCLIQLSGERKGMAKMIITWYAHLTFLVAIYSPQLHDPHTILTFSCWFSSLFILRFAFHRNVHDYCNPLGGFHRFFDITVIFWWILRAFLYFGEREKSQRNIKLILRFVQVYDFTSINPIYRQKSLYFIKFYRPNQMIRSRQRTVQYWAAAAEEKKARVVAAASERGKKLSILAVT